jgi:hypothetical protein
VMFSATARLSSLPRLGLRLPLRAVQAHTHSHTATATVSGVRVRATREREVVEALGRVQEPLSCQSLHHIAAIQVLHHTASHFYCYSTTLNFSALATALHCTAMTIHTFCIPIHSVFDSSTFLRVGATSTCQFSLLIC